MLVGPALFRRLCRARDLLDGGATIDEIAAAIRLSPSHLTRQFEALFGATPHQFRIRARLEQAKALLADGHRSVTAVCLEVGFSSLGSFSDLFARRVGVPPSSYRRRPREPAPGCLMLMGELPRSAFAVLEKTGPVAEPKIAACESS